MRKACFCLKTASYVVPYCISVPVVRMKRQAIKIKSEKRMCLLFVHK